MSGEKSVGPDRPASADSSSSDSSSDSSAADSPALPTGARAPRGLALLLGFRSAPPQWPVAVRTVLCVVPPAALGLLLGDPQAGLTASLGGFTGLFGGGRPYVYRGRLLALLALAQAAAVGLGIWSGVTPWLGVLVVTLIAALSTLLCNAYGVAPAAYQIVLVGATGTALAAEGAPAPTTALLVLAGGLLATAVHLSPALIDRRSPERRVVAQAAEAVAAYVAAIGGPRAEELRTTAAEQLYEAWLALVSQQPLLRHPGRELLRLREISRQVQLLLADAMRRERPDELAAERARRLARQARRRRGEGLDFVAVQLPLGRPTRWETLRQQLRPGSRSLWVLGRVTLASALVGVLGTAVGLMHSYWAVAATVLVLSPGFDRLRTVQRGVQRTAGTVVGIGLALVLLATQPGGGALLAYLAVLVFCTQLLVPRNYAAAAVFITTSALLIAAGGHPAATEVGLALARAGETALGCVTALIVFAAVANRSPGGWLPQSLADTVAAAADALGQLSPGTVTSPAGMAARRRLQARAAALADTFETGLNGFPAQRSTAERLWPAVVATERLSYRVLAEGWRMQDRDHLHAVAIPPPPQDGLRGLAESIRTGRPARVRGAVPSFLSRDVADLTRALGPLDTSRRPDAGAIRR